MDDHDEHVRAMLRWLACLRSSPQSEAQRAHMERVASTYAMVCEVVDRHDDVLRELAKR